MSKTPLEKQVEAFLPTEWGNFHIMAFARESDDKIPHLAMVHEHFDPFIEPTIVQQPIASHSPIVRHNRNDLNEKHRLSYIQNEHER